ncbi:unnamed protein product [Blepharisma stoltei]|uniref:RING-type domain-containing protein n=1 Tax=Blepharisma stoltei TaxID=1481888 RepID=A0AAU9IKE8_9CILI|nr:unnamed protein product [Blepharisma stoltei]
MASNLRVLATESYPNLPKNFTCISKILPRERSFYVSLGTSLIQSMIRIKGTSYANLYWKGLQDRFKEMQIHAKAYNNQALFNIYITLIDVLADQDRYTAIYWLTFYLSTNQDNAIGAIEVGTKCLMCACLSFKTWEFPIIWSSQPYDLTTKKIYLENLANYLRVHILLANDNNFQIFCSSDKATAPLITLYLENYYDYSILYHSEAYALDNSPENLDTNKYPYLYSPRMADSRVEYPKPGGVIDRYDSPVEDPKEKIPPLITDFIKEITKTLTKTAKIPNKDNLLTVTEKLIDKFPEDESILNLHRAISKIPDCSHEITWYTSNCTQEHCLKCLYETIQSSKFKTTEIQCPCNKKISLKCKDEIIEKYAEKPAAKKDSIKKSPITWENENLYSYETQFTKTPKNINVTNEPFTERIRSASAGLSPQQKLQRSNIDFEGSSRPFNIKATDASPKHFNIKRSESVVTKSCILEPEKPFNIKLNEPIKETFKDCENCKEQKEEDEFNTVVCNGHEICSYCRAKSRKARECPICFRKYSDYELSFINALVCSFQEKGMPC